ncbi:hypothetical protein N7540_007714 [Penicillium herquei]|nr:hypothetical protein N7540_007714 [Penicillium herquei]
MRFKRVRAILSGKPQTEINDGTKTKIANLKPKALANDERKYQDANQQEIVQTKAIIETESPERSEDLWVIAEIQLKEDAKAKQLLGRAAEIVKGWGFELATDGVERRKELTKFLDARVADLEDKKWTIGDHGASIKEQTAKIFQKILMLKDVANTAASTSPPAAIACAGVAVALLLFIQTVEHQGSLLKGLDVLAALIPRIYMLEDLYLSPGVTLSSEFADEFKAGLISLICKVLKYQARALCYLDKNWILQFARDLVKKDPWEELREGMKSLEEESHKFTILIDAAERKADRKAREQELQNMLEKYQIWQTTSKRDEKIKRSLRELYTCPYRDRKDRNGRRVPDTCEWFTKHTLFRNWKESHTSASGLLWISADPGCGKSVLAKYLVDEVLLSTRMRTVCYFFFKDDFSDQNNSAGAVASLLRQVLMARPSLFTNTILEKFETDGPQLLGSFQSLWNLFIAIATNENAGDIVCVVDALDECRDEDRLAFIQAISRIYLDGDPKSRSNLKFLITSRPYGHIRSAFHALETNLPTIHLSGEDEIEVKKISEEIDLVVASRVQEIADTKSLENRECIFLQEQLKKITSSNRTYLWVSLTLDFIEKTPGFTRGNVRRVIHDEIPLDVYEAYEKILNRSPDHVKAKRLLHIVTAAKRPLSLDEMSLALAFRPGDAEQAYDDIIDEMEPVERLRTSLRDLCGLLLTVVDQKVYLLHQTVKEFLVRDSAENIIQTSILWKHSIAPKESSRVLAEIGAWLLCMSEGLSILRSLYEYFVEFWPVHFRESCVRKEDQLLLLATQLCDSTIVESARFHEIWNSIGRPRLYYDHMQGDCPRKVSTLMCASYFGLSAIVESILDSGEVDMNEKDATWQRTPMGWAAEKGYDDTVKILLETGKVEFGSVDIDRASPLLCAAMNGHTEVVKVLLGWWSDDVDWPDVKGQTPLLYAAALGHHGVVKLLLETKKVDANSAFSGKRALDRACENEHKEVVRLLLKIGNASADRIPGHHHSPLHIALINKREAIAILLLETGQTDPNQKCGDEKTPLHHAAQSGLETVVKWLLDSGKVSVDLKDRNGQTPLHFAAESGSENIVRMLVDTGEIKDVDLNGYKDRSPLWLAASEGHESVVKFLLSTGKVDPDSRCYQNGSPLLTAAAHGHVSIVKLLLDTKAVEVDAKESTEQRTAFSIAAQYGHTAIVKLLLETGEVDVETRDLPNGRTPLLWAIWNKPCFPEQWSVVRMLVEIGKADVNARDSVNLTALLLAVDRDNTEVVKILLETDRVDVNAWGYRDNTPFGMAVFNEQREMMKLLLSSGKVEVDTPFNDGLIPLLWLAKCGFEDIVPLLVNDCKADCNARAPIGDTALSIAASNGHLKVVEFLLETGKFDVNSRNDLGETALSLASHNGHRDVVLALLDTGGV